MLYYINSSSVTIPFVGMTIACILIRFSVKSAEIGDYSGKKHSSLSENV